MLPSPLQLKELTFLGINITPRQMGENETHSGQPFTFDDVMIGEHIEVALIGEQPETDDQRLFAVKLRIIIANEEGKPAPYSIDMEVVGLFEVSDKIQKENREEMALINGCAVLYSAIRDQVHTYTSRSIYGSLILPTVNFLDRKKPKEHSNQ